MISTLVIHLCSVVSADAAALKMLKEAALAIRKEESRMSVSLLTEDGRLLRVEPPTQRSLPPVGFHLIPSGPLKQVKDVPQEHPEGPVLGRTSDILSGYRNRPLLTRCGLYSSSKFSKSQNDKAFIEVLTDVNYVSSNWLRFQFFNQGFLKSLGQHRNRCPDRLNKGGLIWRQVTQLTDCNVAAFGEPFG